MEKKKPGIKEATVKLVDLKGQDNSINLVLPIFKTSFNGRWAAGRMCKSVEEVIEVYPEYADFPFFYVAVLELPV
jgi:hypothetical protein